MINLQNLEEIIVEVLFVGQFQALHNFSPIFFDHFHSCRSIPSKALWKLNTICCKQNLHRLTRTLTLKNRLQKLLIASPLIGMLATANIVNRSFCTVAKNYSWWHKVHFNWKISIATWISMLAANYRSCARHSACNYGESKLGSLMVTRNRVRGCSWKQIILKTDAILKSLNYL